MADYLIHAANVLYVASYSVRDILWLRLLTVVAIVTLLPYYYTRQEPLLEAIAWSALFLVINGYQLYKLLLERRPVRLNLEQQRLYELAFSTLTPRDFMKLVAVGAWERLDIDMLLVREGESLSTLTVIIDGQVGVERDGEAFAELGPGQFIGEVSYVTRRPACADVRTLAPARVLVWKHEDLRAFLEQHPELRAAVQNVLGSDLAAKLGAPRLPPLRPAPAPA